MMTLANWMRSEGVDDATLAQGIGDFSAEGVRKLRFRSRGPSARVAARIHEITGGKVQPPDMVPTKKQVSGKVSVAAEAMPA